MANESLLAIAYVAIFPSFIAYLFFNRGVELIGSAATGQYMNVMPLMGAGLATLFPGAKLSRFHVAGLALAAAGIVIQGGSVQAPAAGRPAAGPREHLHRAASIGRGWGRQSGWEEP